MNILKLKKNYKMFILVIFLVLGIILISMCQVNAATKNIGDVFVEAYKSGLTQIKTIVNTIVFPALDVALAVAFFFKCGCAFFDYRKQNVFDWTGPAILFACLVLSLLAPSYVWKVVGA